MSNEIIHLVPHIPLFECPVAVPGTSDEFHRLPFTTQRQILIYQKAREDWICGLKRDEDPLCLRVKMLTWELAMITEHHYDGFLDCCCYVDIQAAVPKTLLYEAYKKYFEEKKLGECCMMHWPACFSKCLQEHCHWVSTVRRKVEGKMVSCIKGIALRPRFRMEADHER